MKNHLENQTSPYLLQHAENPVDWYPWGDEAFQRAKREDKPIFLSIGYSACHWCHVMAEESFENQETASILNNNFISVKVDREERPDIDSVYMDVCTLFTGSGGWPTSIFMTPDKKPFFAGTYFPKRSSYAMTGFDDILKLISDKWKSDRETIQSTGDTAVKSLVQKHSAQTPQAQYIDYKLIKKAVLFLTKSFDKMYGGFGNAPKFPMPHNLLFLFDYYEKSGDVSALNMAEKTLTQMYRGGIFDHIGYGFSRYSTDRYFLAPHFEKMLYDNALLTIAYIRAFYITNRPLYKSVAEKVTTYVLREMRNGEGAFYSAQDADSDGEEGKYYLMDYGEILRVLGEEYGKMFCDFYGITEAGNFKGRNIPNLLQNESFEQPPEGAAERLYPYRKTRVKLNIDDKILTSSNSLMIAALCMMYRVTREEPYLQAAEQAAAYIRKYLTDETGAVYVSVREGKRSVKGFLDDYAFYAYGLVHLYEATLQREYLERAAAVCRIVFREFQDSEHGGFYLYGEDGEQLITRPKETYDGALPSGNSVFTYVLVKISNILQKRDFIEAAKKQVQFMCGEISAYPAGSSFFLTALLLYLNPPEHITCVTEKPEELRPLRFKLGAEVRVCTPEEGYAQLNGKTTFYVCRDRTCFPPTNDITRIIDSNNES